MFTRSSGGTNRFHNIRENDGVDELPSLLSAIFQAAVPLLCSSSGQSSERIIDVKMKCDLSFNTSRTFEAVCPASHLWAHFYYLLVSDSQGA